MNLPTDIIVYILQFDNKIKYRNGKFMNQIQLDNDTITMLENIPKKYRYFTGMKPCYWNSFVELYINPIYPKKMIIEYNNYLSNYDRDGYIVKSNITYSFTVKYIPR